MKIYWWGFIGTGDTQTILTVIESYESFALIVGGDTETSGICRISRGWTPTLEEGVPTFYFAKNNCRKLHKNDRIWA